MKKIYGLFILIVMSFLLVGCKTSSITTLSPSVTIPLNQNTATTSISIDWAAVSYYSSLEGSDDIITDMALLLRDTISYVSYGDARYNYAIDSKTGFQYILYDTSGTNVPLTWGDGGAIDTDDNGVADYYVDREHIWACNDMRIMPVNKDRTLDSYVGFTINDGTFEYRPDNSSRGHFSDLFNLWNAVRSVNQKLHSDHFFGETGTIGAPNLSGSIFYPGDEYRGDIARSLFYMTLMYPYLTLVDEDSENANEGTIYYGFLNILLEWNREDPVSEEEIERNETIYETQGNRNPFIDFYDEDIVALIFSSGDPNVLDASS
ncbi:MAG: endonuclease [Bacillales bacterium]|nr:endonuclease [Bacillales bacterium]